MRAILLALLSSFSLVQASAAQSDPPTAPSQATSQPASQPTSTEAKPLAAARQRLQTALRTSASTPDTAFRAVWLPEKGKRAANPFGNLRGGSSSGKATGSWHATRRFVDYAGDQGDRLVLDGTRMIARDDQHAWCLRRDRFADGNRLDHVPDPGALLRQLSAWKLAVTHRSAGAIDDRPVEVISVTLNPEQVGELIWSGSLPATLANGGGNVLVLARGVRRGANQRQAQTPPDITLDLAIAIDPGTNLVHEIRARAWKKQANRGGGQIAFPVGRVVVAGNARNDDEDDEEEEDDEAGTDQAPLVYADGLPKRSRKKMTITNFQLRFSDHGTTKAQPLNKLQQELLR